MNPIKARIAHKYRSLLLRDPPEHDGLRRHIMLQFTPERMQRMKGRATAIIDELIAGIQGRRQIDLIEAFSYPLPVAVICELLGVPAQNERKFHAWSKSLIAGLDPKHLTEADIHKLAVDRDAISAYLGALIGSASKSVAAGNSHSRKSIENAAESALASVISTLQIFPEVLR